MRILMVCLGNICRSPMAEGILKHKAQQLGLNWTVESAGTNSYHIGQAPHRYSQKVCKQHGIDISAQRARTFDPADFEQFDKIYALADDVYDEICRMSGRRADLTKLDFLLNELHENANASVPDPWYGDEDGYLPVFEMIEKACDAILAKYAH